MYPSRFKEYFNMSISSFLAETAVILVKSAAAVVNLS